MSEATCAACGERFSPRRETSAYCSRPCARSKNGGHNRKPETWWTNSRGYVEGRIWEGDKQRRVKFHRHVVEIHLGRALLTTEDVHHIDGDKQNNALENLEVIEHGAHSRVTNSERTYKRGYNSRITPEERQRRSEWMRSVRASQKAARAALSSGQTG